MIAETFRWWLVLEGVGLLALPIALLLFRNRVFSSDGTQCPEPLIWV